MNMFIAPCLTLAWVNCTTIYGRFTQHTTTEYAYRLLDPACVIKNKHGEKTTYAQQ